MGSKQAVNKTTALLVFVKAPLPGKVKTRLARDIGDHAAYDLYKGFLKTIFSKIDAFRDIADIYVFYTPRWHKNKITKTIGSSHNFMLQKGSDLGERIFNSMSSVKKLGYKKILIIGTDSPTIPLKRFHDACSGLDDNDLTIGGTRDGGYYLLGLKNIHAELFSGIDWSTNRVYRQTLERAEKLELKTHTLPEWYDIDTVKDLEEFKKENILAPC